MRQARLQVKVSKLNNGLKLKSPLTDRPTRATEPTKRGNGESINEKKHENIIRLRHCLAGCSSLVIMSPSPFKRSATPCTRRREVMLACYVPGQPFLQSTHCHLMLFATICLYNNHCHHQVDKSSIEAYTVFAA